MWPCGGKGDLQCTNNATSSCSKAINHKIKFSIITQKFPGPFKFQEISRRVFKFQEISRSCRHPVQHTFNIVIINSCIERSQNTLTRLLHKFVSAAVKPNTDGVTRFPVHFKNEIAQLCWKILPDHLRCDICGFRQFLSAPSPMIYTRMLQVLSI